MSFIKIIFVNRESQIENAGLAETGSGERTGDADAG